MEFYSNCLIEALKAKIKNPKKIKITYVPPRKSTCFQSHFMWSDGKKDYDFGAERRIGVFEQFCFCGEIRERNLGFNEHWKRNRTNSKL